MTTRDDGRRVLRCFQTFFRRTYTRVFVCCATERNRHGGAELDEVSGEKIFVAFVTRPGSRLLHRPLFAAPSRSTRSSA